MINFVQTEPFNVKLELTNEEIDKIIEELNNVNHSTFEFMNYKDLIDKLRNAEGK
jgi:hypothetical protein